MRYDVVILLCLGHINRHIRREDYLLSAFAYHFIVILIFEKCLICVLILQEFLRQIVLVTNRQRQFVVDGIDKHCITQNMTIDGKEERKTATVNALEEGALAETHHPFASLREVVDNQLLLLGDTCRLRLVIIVDESVSRKSKTLDKLNHLARIKSAELVTLFGLEFYGTWYSIGEI